MNFPILSSLILLPSIGALFLFFTKSDKKKLTSDEKRATYFEVLLFSFLLFEKNKNKAPIVGNIIKEERIGKFIILQLKKLIMQKNQVTLQKHIDI